MVVDKRTVDLEDARCSPLYDVGWVVLWSVMRRMEQVWRLPAVSYEGVFHLQRSLMKGIRVIEPFGEHTSVIRTGHDQLVAPPTDVTADLVP